VSLLQQRARSLENEIRERQAVEERLRLSENRYHCLLEASTDGILTVDPHSGLILDANPSIMHLLGLSRVQLVNHSLWQVGLLPDQLSQQAQLQRLQQERLLRTETRLLTSHNGPPCFVEWVCTLVQANGDEVIQCNIRDITDRKRAEEASKYLAAIVSSSDDAILSKDIDGIITSWNAAAERMYGYSEQEIVGQPVSVLFLPDRQDEFTSIMERIRRGECVNHYETRRVHKDGTILTVSVTVSPIKMSDGT